MPSGSPETVWAVILRTGGNSLGLPGIAFALSLLFGILLGLSAVRTNPPGVAAWPVPASAVSLALPSFYIGAVTVTATIFWLLYGGEQEDGRVTWVDRRGVWPDSPTAPAASSALAANRSPMCAANCAAAARSAAPSSPAATSRYGRCPSAWERRSTAERWRRTGCM